MESSLMSEQALWEIKANFDAYRRWLREGDSTPILEDDEAGYWCEFSSDPTVTKKELRAAVSFLAMQNRELRTGFAIPQLKRRCPGCHGEGWLDG